MPRRIPQRTRLPTVRQTTPVRLRVILHQLEPVLPAQRPNLLRIRQTAVQMHDANRPRPLADPRLNQVLVHLQRLGPRLHQHRRQPVLRNRQNRRDIGIRRHDHLVPRLHHAQFHIRPEYPNQRIQAVRATDAIRRTDIVRIMFLEALVLAPLQVPPALHHAAHCRLNLSAVQRRHIFQRKKRNVIHNGREIFFDAICVTGFYI